MSLVAQIGLLATRVATEFNTLRAERRVAVATLANITLSGTQTIDGIAVVAGDLVLVKNQNTPSQNGIYKVAAGAWTRVARFSTAAGIAGSRFEVMKGTVNGGTNWQTSFKSTDTVGTTSMLWMYVGDLPGTIKAWGGSTLPDGWMWCSGGGINKVNYPAYDYYVGANYGGDATSNYTPSMNDLNRTLRYGAPGDQGGSNTSVITASNLPPHAHAIDHNHAAVTTSSDSHAHASASTPGPAPSSAGTSLAFTRGSAATQSVGGGMISADAHTHTVDLPNFAGSSGNGPGTSDPLNTYDPYVTAYFIIKIV